MISSQVSPSELAARASPTAPRRSDLPKIDSNLLSMHSQQQFPLPPSITSSAAAAMMQHHRSLNTMSGVGGPGSGGGGDSGSDAEDLRVPSSSPFGGSTGSGGGKSGFDNSYYDYVFYNFIRIRSKTLDTNFLQNNRWSWSSITHAFF